MLFIVNDLQMNINENIISKREKKLLNKKTRRIKHSEAPSHLLNNPSKEYMEKVLFKKKSIKEQLKEEYALYENTLKLLYCKQSK